MEMLLSSTTSNSSLSISIGFRHLAHVCPNNKFSLLLFEKRMELCKYDLILETVKSIFFSIVILMVDIYIYLMVVNIFIFNWQKLLKDPNDRDKKPDTYENRRS
jgi:hypothetical protein